MTGITEKNTMPKKVIDVLLIRAHDEGRRDDAEEAREVVDLMRRTVPLSSDGHILVGWDRQLPPHKDILDCCLSSWKWSGKTGFHPTRQFGTNFALINQRPAKPDEYNWDPDQRLGELVALSRIVHSSATSFDYCARLTRTGDSEWDIIPAGGESSAYTNNPRSFLRLGEWQATARLVEKWRTQKLVPRVAKGRVANALWWRERAAREYYSEARWPFLVTAIESLVKIWGKRPRFGSTDNFVRGMRMLAKSLRRPYTQREAKKAYEIRSTHTHGGRWPVNFVALYRIKSRRPQTLLNDRRRVELQGRLYDKTEAILDAALRKAIEDDGFGKLFLDNDLLANHLKTAI